MSDLNVLTITGRLTRDAVLKTLPTGTNVCEFSVACNGYQDKATFFDVSLFGKAGPGVAQYLTKGKPVAVSGALESQEWTGQDGMQHKRFVLKTFGVTLLGGGTSSSTQSSRPAREPEPTYEIEEEDVAF